MEQGRRLEGKHAVVTAGAGGIGRAIAERLAREGAKIAICDTSESALQEVSAAHQDWLCVKADVSDSSSVRNFFEAVTQRFGRLDCLVNNAGIAGPTAQLADIPEDEWQRVIGVNLMGGVHCTREAIPLLAKGGASVVFLSSIAGRVGVPERTPYTATKWAVIGLMKSLAIELGPRKVRVNAVLPGLTMGERLEGVIRARALSFGRSFEEQMEHECRYVALGEPCQGEDIAAATAFLASDDSLRITGVAMPVDGGLDTANFR